MLSVVFEKIEHIFEQTLDKHLFDCYTEYVIERLFAEGVMKKNMKAYLIIVFILVSLIILILGSTALTISAKQETADIGNSYNVYESYEIRPSDTLWDIARVYAPAYHMSTADYVKTLKELNHLKSDRITSGRHLIVVVAADSVR